MSEDELIEVILQSYKEIDVCYLITILNKKNLFWFKFV